MSQEHWLDRMKTAREMAARANVRANEAMKRRADKNKEPHDLEVGDTVWVKEMRVPKGKSPKLSPKAADVEYKVAELTGGGKKHAKVVAVANPLDQRSLHVERLKKVVREPAGLFGEEEEAGDAHDENEFEVERILGHRSSRKGNGIEYFIRWKGFGAAEDSWVPAKGVHADEAVAKYERERMDSKDRRVEIATLTYAEVAKKAQKVSTPRQSPAKKVQKVSTPRRNPARGGKRE
jgi:hypothetical protein